MIEVNETIDVETMRRQQEFSRAQESYQRAVFEGRLIVRSRQGAPGTDGSAVLVAPDRGVAGGRVATSVPPPEVATSTTVPAETRPPDPEVAWRHTRLAITAGLVVLLLVVWIWQKRRGR